MPHFYRTLAKFRAPKQSKGNHTSCFRVEENCLMAWRRDFFPSGIAHLGCDIMGFLLWSAKYWSAGHHENHNGELTDQGESHIFWIFEGWFLLVCKRKWPKQSFAWVWPAVLSHPAPASFNGRRLLRVVCQLISIPIYKDLFKEYFTALLPAKEKGTGRQPPPFLLQTRKKIAAGCSLRSKWMLTAAALLEALPKWRCCNMETISG